jgi:two-component system response regulator GlrR
VTAAGAGANSRDGATAGGRPEDRPTGRRREDRIVGASDATRRVIEQVLAAARSTLPIWVVGPRGSGKELVARAIHAWSDRANHPFVAVDCAALAPESQVRDLFGAGAGASGAGEPALARAAQGTLFLRGVTALGTAGRAALAEALSRPSPTRIAFSSENDEAAPLLGSAAHHRLVLLPLTERPEDVLPLAAHFLAAAADEFGIRAVGFASEARALLLSEPWPGNVRELKARVREAVRLGSGGAVSAEALLLAGEEGEVPSFKDAKRAFETRYVANLLRRCNGNISRAARLAKKDRKDFYDVIRRTGVDPMNFRA